MATESSLASVLGATLGKGYNQRFVEWSLRQVDSNDPLGQLHAKFWGKSMADEEEEWRIAQSPPSTGNIEDQSQDGDDDTDNGTDNGGDEGKDEDEDEDEGTDEGGGLANDDDVIPGCYMLDIGIEGLETSKMWIRAEYVRIFDYIEDFFQEPGFPPGRPPCAVITGQPGIGKSVWIYYAIRRYLAEKKPVIWYRKQKSFLFVDEGVYVGPPDYSDDSFVAFVRTLVDSDESISGVPERLVCHGTRHSVIYATSPREERWKRLHKTVRVVYIVMNPWFRKEILRAAHGLFSDIEEERINDVFDRFGPTPRLCIEYSRKLNSFKKYEFDVRHIISALTVEQLEKLFRDSHNLAMDANSHKICLISRESDFDGDIVVTPITRSIRFRLASQFRKLGRDEQIRLYQRFAKVPGSRVLAGIFFEAAGLRQLQDGIKLDTMPMVRLSKSREGTLPQWHSSHLPIINKSLEKSRRALQKGFTIDIPEPECTEYGDGGPESIDQGILYVPECTNQVALDSFIWFNKFLYIFQFTIGKNHGIKPGLVDWFGRYKGLPTVANWRFVFLLEPNQYLTCPQPRSLKLRKLCPSSAVLSFEKAIYD